MGPQAEKLLRDTRQT